jgi:hypothetical protein
MSSKSKFSPDKKKPRPLEEIGKEYGEMRSRLGDAQYQEYIWKIEAGRLCRILKELNQEAAEAQKLEQAKAEPVKVELPSEVTVNVNT